MVHRAFYCLALSLPGVTTILQPVWVFGQTAEPSNERQKFESAWKDRTDVVKSLILAVDVVEIAKGRGKQTVEQSGPFAEDAPKTDRKLRSKAEFYFDKGKTAITEIKPGYTNEDAIKMAPQTFRATFDGQLNASLVQQAENLSGSIERKSEACGHITQNGLMVAVNLWLQPELTLKHIDWDTSNLTIENEFTEVGGIQCRRIRIPRSSPNWTSALEVDPDKGWLPMQWQTWLNGRLTMKLVIEYENDKNIGHAISGWSYTRYDQAGESELIRSAHVTRCETNVKIAPNRFTIDFPIGTRIWEDIRGARRYYVQKAEGMVPVR